MARWAPSHACCNGLLDLYTLLEEGVEAEEGVVRLRLRMVEGGVLEGEELPLALLKTACCWRLN